MDFGEQIRIIRQKRHLTQDELARQLNITRQAVSNWENNKNLPDIGMLIRISDVFDVSLDDLIKGDCGITKLTTKIVKEGSETKRLIYNRISIFVGMTSFLLGLMLLFIKSASVEYVDSEGVLHENFFLLPFGFFFMCCGLLLFLSIGIRKLYIKVFKRNLQ